MTAKLVETVLIPDDTPEEVGIERVRLALMSDDEHLDRTIPVVIRAWNADVTLVEQDGVFMVITDDGAVHRVVALKNEKMH